MRAMVAERYGPPEVLALRDVPRPVPADDEILVAVHAVSVNPADWHTLRADPFLVRFMGGGLFKPKHTILGIDVAGRVEAVGGGVTSFEPGDEVFGASKWGGFAEYTSVKNDRLLPKPARSSIDEAAAVPVAALTALQGLRDAGRLRAGDDVLVNGASGGVGTFAVQIAKAFGAHVTGVCSTGNLELVRSIGADHVIDYTREDFTEDGRLYDVILDAAAFRPVARNRHALKPGGRYVLVGGAPSRLYEIMFLAPLLSIGGKRMGFMFTRMNGADLITVKELIDAGEVTPVIDRHYALSDLPEALRYLEKGHARGKVVITV